MNNIFKDDSARKNSNDTFIENIQNGLNDGHRKISGEAATVIETPAGSDIAQKNYSKINFIDLNGVNYKVIKQLEVFSAESDIYLIENPSAGAAGNILSPRYILKHYRFGITPKEEVIEILKSLPKKSVVEIMESGKTPDGRFYEIQQYLSAGSLREYLNKIKGGVSQEFVREFITGLNECLFDIHSKNVIHRDIKPANILIKNIRPLEIVLTDFGISSVSEFSLHQTSMNRTILYSSPESMSGVISRATDYWALGLIALEMLLNRHPFAAIDDKTLIYWLATRPVPGIDEAGGVFTDLIKGLLTRDPQKRWGYRQIKDFFSSPQNGIPNYFEENEDDFQAAVYDKTLSGEPPDNFAKAAPRKCRPYKFNGHDYLNLQELSAAMAENWNRALGDFNSGKLRNWISRELRDDNAKFLIEDLSRDSSITSDEKLFEFFCRANNEFSFIYKGFHIGREWLTDTAYKILKREAPAEEIELIKELARGAIIEKYYEINANESFYKSLEPVMNDLKVSAEDPQKCARLILVNYSDSYKEKLTAKIRDILSNNIIIRPFEMHDFTDEQASDEILIKKTAEKLNSIIEGRQYSFLDLIDAAGARRECVLSKESLEEMHRDFKKVFEDFFKNISCKEFSANSEKYLKPFRNDNKAFEPAALYESIISLYNREIEYSFSFYKTLRELDGCVRIYKMKSEVLNAPSINIELGDRVFIELIKVAQGSFVMGGESGFDDEMPAHKVIITRPYYIGKITVTQRQWEKIMGSNPSYFKRSGGYPVEKVSWNDCLEFINRLNGLGLIDGQFRLPTEAEWEYASRAGSETKYYWGDDSSNAGNYCWHKGNSNLETHICGQKLPNALGLFDMAGNVREWCGDWYAPYKSGDAVNPQGPPHGSLRVARGGDWSYEADDCTSSGRDYLDPAFRDSNLGFRLVFS